MPTLLPFEPNPFRVNAFTILGLAGGESRRDRVQEALDRRAAQLAQSKPPAGEEAERGDDDPARSDPSAGEEAGREENESARPQPPAIPLAGGRSYVITSAVLPQSGDAILDPKRRIRESLLAPTPAPITFRPEWDDYVRHFGFGAARGAEWLDLRPLDFTAVVLRGLPEETAQPPAPSPTPERPRTETADLPVAAWIVTTKERNGISPTR